MIFSTIGAAWSRTFFQASATDSLTVSAAAAARFCVEPSASLARSRLDWSASAAMPWALSARSSAASRIAARVERLAFSPRSLARAMVLLALLPPERTINAIRPIRAAPAAAEMSSALVGSSRA